MIEKQQFNHEYHLTIKDIYLTKSYSNQLNLKIKLYKLNQII